MILSINRGASVICSFTPATGSALKQGLQGDDYLDIFFTSPVVITIQLGDFIDYRGMVYKINRFPQVRKVATTLFEYNIKAESRIYDLAKAVFFDSTGNYPDFEMTGDPDAFLALVVDNLNRWEGSTVWVAGSTVSKPLSTMNFSAMNCMEALRDIASNFGLEYALDFLTDTLTLVAAGGGAATQTLAYKTGLRELTRELITYDNMATVLYGFGGTQNIPADYRNHYTPADPRTGLPRLVFSGTGVTVNDVQKNVATYGRFERTVIFEDIFPRANFAVETAYVDYKGFHCDAIDFDINDYRIGTLTWTVKFTSGDLEGYEFPISYYDHSTHSLLFQTIDEGAVTLPNVNTHCHAGDTFVLLNIGLPDAYISDAEDELEAAVTAEIEKFCYPQVKYAVQTDWQYLKTEAIELTIGQVVEITDANLGLTAQAIRIVSLEQSLLNEWDYRLDLSEFVQTNLTKQVVTNLRRLNVKMSNMQAGSLKSGGGVAQPLNYRSGTETTGAGSTTIVFSDPVDFLYTLGAVIFGVSAVGGNWIPAIPTNLTVLGFDIDFGEIATFDYTALEKR